MEKGQVDASYNEVLHGQNLWEGVTATFLQSRSYRNALTRAQLQELIYKAAF
jgi:hypothetical protein